MRKEIADAIAYAVECGNEPSNLIQKVYDYLVEVAAVPAVPAVPAVQDIPEVPVAKTKNLTTSKQAHRDAGDDKKLATAIKLLTNCSEAAAVQQVKVFRRAIKLIPSNAA